MRIDRLLWFLRFAKTRAIAQVMAEAGHIRINGRRLDRAHQPVVPGDVLVIPLGSRVRVIEVLTLPTRRGPPGEAQACYRPLDDSAPAESRGLATPHPLDEAGHSPIAAPPPPDAAERDLQP